MEEYAARVGIFFSYLWRRVFNVIKERIHLETTVIRHITVWKKRAINI